MRLTCVVICMILQLAVSAGCSSSASSSVVSGVGESQRFETDSKTSNAGLTDEDITKRFTECIREHGLNVSDPEVSADGTVNLRALKEDWANNTVGKVKSGEILDECLPLLQGATFSEKESAEDQIELQDLLLEFAQCLRDDGHNVRDPIFSDDDRLSKETMFAELKGADSRVQRSINSCSERVFGAEKSDK